ncbi:MAG: helix-turn-helix domain-containing protein [bacterium]
MGLFSRIFKRKEHQSGSEHVQEKHTSVHDDKDNIPSKPQDSNSASSVYSRSFNSQSTALQTQQQNRDFIYGVGFGAFKSDFEELKEKLRKIHDDMAQNHSLILGKAEELSEDHRGILDLLGDNRKKLGLLVEKADQYSEQPNIPTELAEDLKKKVDAATLSLRQAEIYELVKKGQLVTAKDISQCLSIAENTATEHLRNLEKLGFLVRVSRGLYKATEAPNHTPAAPLPEPSPELSDHQDEA